MTLETEVISNQASKNKIKIVSFEENLNGKNLDGKKKNKKVIKSTDEYHGTDCGCGSFRPNWLQKIRSPISFLINFSILGILRAAYFTYTISCLSTIEKRYSFPAKLSAVILICDNISGLLLNPIVGYLGTRINGPKLIGIGTIIVSISCLFSALPYFVYGHSTILLSSDLSHNQNLNFYTNKTQTKYDYCDTENENCFEQSNSFNYGAFLILCLASFTNGLGYTSFYTIGLPYIDDNTKKKNSPIYISVMTIIRMSGVGLGYFLSSYTLSLYETPSLRPNISTKDPRWVGAWWLGYIIIGVLMFISSFPFFLFPPSMRKPIKKTKNNYINFQDAKTRLVRILKNPIIVFDTIGGCFRSIGFAGYWINKPRYIEAQFHQSASASSFLTGSTGIVMKIIGNLFGGIMMSRFKPKPKKLVMFIITVELISNALMFSAMFVGRPSPVFADISYNKTKPFLACNQDCNCTRKTFQPVCSSDGFTNYFTPCFAGCDSKQFKYDEQTKTTEFFNCKCEESMKSGYCKTESETESGSLAIYLIILSFTGIITSFARTPNILIAIRSVHDEDKTFLVGLVGSFMSIFAYIPYPVIFGFVLDSACVVWENTCGSNGNCWLYDLRKMRIYLHSAAVSFMVAGSLCDIVIYFYADRLKNLYDDEECKEADKNSENNNNDIVHNLNEINLYKNPITDLIEETEY